MAHLIPALLDHLSFSPPPRLLPFLKQIYSKHFIRFCDVISLSKQHSGLFIKYSSFKMFHPFLGLPMFTNMCCLVNMPGRGGGITGNYPLLEAGAASRRQVYYFSWENSKALRWYWLVKTRWIATQRWDKNRSVLQASQVLKLRR